MLFIKRKLRSRHTRNKSVDIRRWLGARLSRTRLHTVRVHVQRLDQGRQCVPEALLASGIREPHSAKPNTRNYFVPPIQATCPTLQDVIARDVSKAAGIDDRESECHKHQPGNLLTIINILRMDTTRVPPSGDASLLPGAIQRGKRGSPESQIKS